MKLLHLILTGSVFAFACLANAQSFSTDWFTIDGGGGAASVGNYSLAGTIGQPDAGPSLSVGSFSLTGGFWSLFSAPSPNLPVLRTQLTPTNTLVISWPSSLGGFALQQTTSLASSNWSTPTETVNDDGANKFIIVNPVAGSRFFRLLKP